MSTTCTLTSTYCGCKSDSTTPTLPVSTTTVAVSHHHLNDPFQLFLHCQIYKMEKSNMPLVRCLCFERRPICCHPHRSIRTNRYCYWCHHHNHPQGHQRCYQRSWRCLRQRCCCFGSRCWCCRSPLVSIALHIILCEKHFKERGRLIMVRLRPKVSGLEKWADW